MGYEYNPSTFTTEWVPDTGTEYSGEWWNRILGGGANWPTPAIALSQVNQSDPRSSQLMAEGFRRGVFTEPQGDDFIGQYGPAIIGGLALAGMGGFLPGTESIFGGAAGGAAGAAEGIGAYGGATDAASSIIAGSAAPAAGTVGLTGAAGNMLTSALPEAAASGLSSGLTSAGTAFNPATASLSDIVNAVSASGGNAVAASPLTAELAAAASSGATLSSLSPSLLTQVADWVSSTTGTPVTGSQLLSGGLSAVGGLLSGNAAQNAAQTTANAQLEAARIAADAARFRPIGVTTRFGQSNFTRDAQGNVTGAGYTLTPDIRAQQDALMAQSGNMLTQYQNAPAAFAPMGVAGQTAMTLGNQYLATDPQAQAQKYYNDQQALLATGRERDTNNMLTGEFNRGTYGLSTGSTSTGMMGANPRLEALYNAQRQQDLGLAAQATQGGMDYAKFGAGMAGTGGDLTRAMYQGQTAAFDPYRTALTGAQTLEGLGQNALTMGMDLGRQTSNAVSGGLLAQGMNNAAQTMQPANAYSPWGAMLSGAGNTVANYANPTANQRYRFDPFTGSPL
jgi:hypothetical protein